MLKAIMILLIIAITILLIWIGIGWFERSNLFYPTTDLAATPADFHLPYDNVTLTTPDGEKLNAWFFPVAPQQKEKEFTILLHHGNGGNISHRLDKIARLHKLGFHVFIFDYRGFGKSSGKPNEKGLYLDAETALQYLATQKNIPLGQIVFYGESLGGAVATEMAARHQGKALILEDTFTSTVNMSKFLFPWLPAQYLVQNRFDNVSKIPTIKCPILIFHSREDETVPFFMGESLYKAAPKGTKFIELSGPHNDAYALCSQQYEEGIVQFLRQ